MDSLIRGSVPVDLAHGTRLENNKCSREHGRDGESGRVEDLNGSAGSGEGLLLRPVVRVSVGWRQRAGRRGDVLLGDVGGGRRAVEDEELLLRHVLESARVGLEVLGHDGGGRAHEDLGGQERAVLGEVAVVEDEQELDALVEGLDAVWDAGREEPHVTGGEVVDETLAVGVDGGDADGTLQHKRPFALSKHTLVDAHSQCRHCQEEPYRSVPLEMKD